MRVFLNETFDRGLWSFSLEHSRCSRPINTWRGMSNRRNGCGHWSAAWGTPTRREVSLGTPPGRSGSVAISFTAINITLVFFCTYNFLYFCVWPNTRRVYLVHTVAEHAIDTQSCACTCTHTRNRFVAAGRARFRVSMHVTTRTPDGTGRGRTDQTCEKNTFLVARRISRHWFTVNNYRPAYLPRTSPFIFARVSWFRRVMRFIDFSRAVPKFEIVCSRNFRSADDRRRNWCCGRFRVVFFSSPDSR